MQFKYIDPEKLANRLVEVFASDKLTAEYMRNADMRMGICGWNGVMSPLTRLTYVQDFGEAVVKAAEAQAAAIVNERREWFKNSQYAAHAKIADGLAEQGANYRPAKGDYVWCVTSGLKGESGLPGELNALVRDCERPETATSRLVLIREVCEITDGELMDSRQADQLVQQYALTGGSRSDDAEIKAPQDWIKQTKEQQDTWYTFGAAVVTPSGKWYVIDSEGYSYARYIYMPTLWREIFKAEADEIEARRRQEAEAEAKRLADEKAQRLAAYVEACNKWESLMIPVQPLIEAAKNHSYGTPERKAAERAINNACRKNILTMARAAFPGVKFSLTRHDGWGHDWALTWTDGPTEAEFNAATDLQLFCSSYDTYDGMTDCAYSVRMEFTEFATKYMRWGGEIKVTREQSHLIRAAIEQLLKEIKPEAAKDPHERFYWTEDELQAAGKRFGISFDRSTMEEAGCYGSCVIYTVARVLFESVSFYKPQEPAPGKSDDTPHKDTADGHDGNDNGKEEDKPHKSLSLKAMPGGVYVDGSSRATYYNRREIKAHGATWNKTTQRWEATAPEAVATLRAWFGQSA